MWLRHTFIKYWLLFFCSVLISIIPRSEFACFLDIATSNSRS